VCGQGEDWVKSAAASRVRTAPPLSAWEIYLLAILLIVLAGALLSLAWRTGVTIDEPSHLLSAHRAKTT
jgi:hypothetical protein